MESKESMKDVMTLRAIRDFCPKEMNQRETTELRTLIKRDSRVRLMTCMQPIGGEERNKLLQIERYRRGFERYARRKHGDKEYDKEESDGKHNENLNDSGLYSSACSKEIDLESDDSTTFVNADDILREETSDIENQADNIVKVEDQKTLFRMEEMIMFQDGPMKSSRSVERSDSENFLNPSQLDWGYRSISGSDHSCLDSEDEAEPCAVALAIKTGDKLEAIPPANICDKVEWWKVRHLNSGQIGFIQRNSVVVERHEQSSKTTLNELPLELLDVILQHTFLLSMLKVRADDRDDDVIRTLASVDFRWFHRTTIRRFKKRIWQRLTRFYGKTRKRYVIIRNNQNYLLENINPNDKLISSLLSLDCITEKQCHLIQRQRLRRDKNAEILHAVKSSSGQTFSSFVNCLRQTNQKTVARILENGGVVTKATVRDCGAKDGAPHDPQLLRQRFIDPHTGSKTRSRENEKLIIKLKEDGIEILDTQLDGQTVVVWICCHSQAAVENIQKLYESNKLSESLAAIANVSMSISEIFQSTIIHMDSEQFERTFVAFSIFFNFTKRLDFGNDKRLYGLTKLRNEIYVLCQSPFSSSSPEVITVFEDRYPFRLQRNIPIRQIEHPWDIGSSEMDNCLYVFDFSEDNTVWKITRDACTDDQETIVKWLTTDHQPLTMSVSSEGQLLMTSWKSSILKVYGPDAGLLRSIPLPGDIHEPVHAVETSMGNIIVLHKWKGDEGDVAFSGREWWESKWGICEVTGDGQRVIRHFLPSNETQNLNNSRYLRLDSDDRVFVADYWNHRVVLLDSDLKWNQTICSTTGKENRIRETNSLFYDDIKQQLIVGGFPSGQGINVYTLNRN